MSTLIVDELITELEQEIIVKEDILNGVIFKPWLYIHNAPSGTFKFGVYEGANLLFEKTFDSAFIKSELNTTDNFAHLFLSLPFPNESLKAGVYKMKLSSVGYVFNSSSWLGWIKDFESNFEKNNDLESIEFTQYPLTTRILVMKRREF